METGTQCFIKCYVQHVLFISNLLAHQQLYPRYQQNLQEPLLYKRRDHSKTDYVNCQNQYRDCTKLVSWRESSKTRCSGPKPLTLALHYLIVSKDKYHPLNLHLFDRYFQLYTSLTGDFLFFLSFFFFLQEMYLPKHLYFFPKCACSLI